MEQIVLYLAVLAALSGFGMGLMNIAGPLLKRRNITLPPISIATLLRRGTTGVEVEDDFDLDDEEDIETARDFADASFVADPSLLRRRRAIEGEDEEIDEELAGVLDLVATEEVEAEEDDEEFEDDDGPVIYTVSAGADDGEAEADAYEDDDEETDEDEDEDDEEGDEDGEGDEEASKPELHVVAASDGGGNDILSFFGEGADAGGKVHLAWRDDLPEVSIQELLAEARSISQRIQGKKHNAA